MKIVIVENTLADKITCNNRNSRTRKLLSKWRLIVQHISITGASFRDRRIKCKNKQLAYEQNSRSAFNILLDSTYMKIGPVLWSNLLFLICRIIKKWSAKVRKKASGTEYYALLCFLAHLSSYHGRGSSWSAHMLEGWSSPAQEVTGSKVSVVAWNLVHLICCLFGFHQLSRHKHATWIVLSKNARMWRGRRLNQRPCNPGRRENDAYRLTTQPTTATIVLDPRHWSKYGRASCDCLSFNT